MSGKKVDEILYSLGCGCCADMRVGEAKSALKKAVMECVPEEKNGDWSDCGFKWKAHEENGFNEAIELMLTNLNKLFNNTVSKDERT